jgi:FAD/FMN-containing dehydrogenase
LRAPDPDRLSRDVGDRRESTDDHDVGTATAEQVGRLWNPADRARLLQIRDRVDPTGLFATNIHIG